MPDNLITRHYPTPLCVVIRLSGIVRRFLAQFQDRKSTRLNSSHQIISYAVFCLKKKKTRGCTPVSMAHPAHRIAAFRRVAPTYMTSTTRHQRALARGTTQMCLMAHAVCLHVTRL